MKRLSTILAIALLVSLPAFSREPGSPVPLPPLDREIAITSWHVVGPFLSGSREPLVDPLGSTFDRDTGTVDLDATYPSVQAFGGSVGWQLTTAGPEGSLAVSFDQPDWEKIMDEWGGSGISFLAAAYSTFECDKPCRALINANGIGGFYINGRLYTGDPYGHSLIRTPVILDQGENRVLFFLGGYGGSDSVSFQLAPPEGDVMILDRDILLPDLVRGESLSSPAGIPIVNTTDIRLKDITISVGGTPPFLKTEMVVPDLPPLTVIKQPLDLTTDGAFPDSWEGDQVEVPIKIKWSDQETTIQAVARVRAPSDSRLVTFTSSMDLSAQKYAVLYPTNYDPSCNYSLILALHGAGVECEGMADAFEAKDWAFVVAPTNRRSFGFDWQDWGRLDALEVLQCAMERYPIDPDRVYLVGHSMGGHGTWHVGCTHADKFAAIVPSAGWASFQLYTPWFLRMDEMLSDPDLARVFDQTTSPDRTERLLPNLRNTPVLAVQGGNDDDVPPTHGRFLTGLLERMGYDVRYWEEPGQAHWWDTHPWIPGADCVDGLRIRSFLRERERDPYPRHVTLATYDLGNTCENYWVRVDEEISPIGLVYVDAELSQGRTLKCSTQNVRRLTFDFGEGFPHPVPISVEIDGEIVDMDLDENGRAHFMYSDSRWYSADSPETSGMKTPEFRGPMKRAYFSPFVIVVGTRGTEEENRYYMELARSTAQRWWYRANGYTRIVRDIDVTDSTLWQYNLVLIGPGFTNNVSDMMDDGLPIRVRGDGVLLGDQLIAGQDLACKFVYPNPYYPDKLILAEWGTSLNGMRLAGSLNCLYSGSGLPDFLVYGEQVKLMGYAGVRAAGFFDNAWQLDPEFYYLRR